MQLQAEKIGMALTESYAMLPAAAVSGFYLAHPESCYFAVGKIGEVQVVDLASREGSALADVQRRLSTLRN